MVLFVDQILSSQHGLSRKEAAMRLENRIAVITGAGRGIGKAIAFRFAQEGADLVIADVDMDEAQETAKEIRVIGRKSIAVECDVANSSQVKAVVQDTLQQLGRIDVLVNNAGIRPISSLLETSEAEWNRTMAVNLTAQFLFIKEVAPCMVKQGKGKIINMASVLALKPNRNRLAYAVSKAGVAMLTKCAALELGPEISVNAIAPGMIHTSMTDRYLQEDTPDSMAMKALLKTWPIPRMGRAEEIANMAVFLASDESDFCTGSLFIMDGGSMLS
jgi:NAD(P)-dependent dehydrogenase (short-subunit alcohol dehydrogenase family)